MYLYCDGCAKETFSPVVGKHWYRNRNHCMGCGCFYEKKKEIVNFIYRICQQKHLDKGAFFYKNGKDNTDDKQKEG